MTSTKTTQYSVREISSRQNIYLRNFCDNLVEKGLLSAKVDFSKLVSRISEHLLKEEYVCSEYDFEYLNNCLRISKENTGITLREILIEYTTQCFNDSSLKQRTSQELIEEISTSCVPSAYAFICSDAAIPLYLLGLIKTTERAKNEFIFQLMPFSDSETTINTIFTHLPIRKIELKRGFKMPITEFLLCFEWYVRELRVVSEISKFLGSNNDEGGQDLPPANINLAGLTNCLKWKTEKASEENKEFEESWNFLILGHQFQAKKERDMEEAKKHNLGIVSRKRENLESDETTKVYSHQELRR